MHLGCDPAVSGRGVAEYLAVLIPLIPVIDHDVQLRGESAPNRSNGRHHGNLTAAKDEELW
jgi:hypothetical protein